MYPNFPTVFIFLMIIGSSIAGFLHLNSNIPEDLFNHSTAKLDNETVALFDEAFDLAMKLIALKDRLFDLMDEDKVKHKALNIQKLFRMAT